MADMEDFPSVKNLTDLLQVVLGIHIGLCPFTKVEESFNLQAIHDIFHHGWNLDKYDHLEFPGVVPRTFLGPLLVSLSSSPVVLIVKQLSWHKLTEQSIVRGVLGWCILLVFRSYCQEVRVHFGQGVMRWLVLLTVTQFHFIFYVSRPLPNTFALGFVLMAMTCWLRQRHAMFAWMAGVACIVFRSETLIFLGFYVLSDLLRRRWAAVVQVVKCAVPAAMALLCLTVLVDSIFWRRLLWPEGEVLWFNVYLNKSSQWGTSPFLWYFYSVLPRALMGGLVLCVWGCLTSRPALMLVWPAVAYIVTYSFLPHKELRFIIYTFPVLNTAAAVGADALWRKWNKSFVHLGLVGLLAMNAAGTLAFLGVSRLNYPGGQAMSALHKLEHQQSYVNVHIDVYTAQTGVSRFTQVRDSWSYNKTENLVPGGRAMMEFTHLMVGVLSDNQSELAPYTTTHTVLHIVSSYSGTGISSRFPFLQIRSKPTLWILKRKPIETEHEEHDQFAGGDETSEDFDEFNDFEDDEMTKSF